jgi:hypothetical protein
MSVGTFVATGLVRAFRRESRAVDALKPVVTGFDALAAESGDLAHLIAAWDGPLGADALAESKSPTPRWFPSLSSSFVVGRQRPPETGVPSWAREMIAHYLVELITYFCVAGGRSLRQPGCWRLPMVRICVHRHLKKAPIAIEAVTSRNEERYWRRHANLLKKRA